MTSNKCEPLKKRMSGKMAPKERMRRMHKYMACKKGVKAGSKKGVGKK